MHPRNAGAENAGSGTLCRQCREPFAQKRPWQKFCSTVCRRTHHSEGGAKQIEDLERRVRELEAAVWPLGK